MHILPNLAKGDTSFLKEHPARNERLQHRTPRYISRLPSGPSLFACLGVGLWCAYDFIQCGASPDEPAHFSAAARSATATALRQSLLVT
ncbi:hypothetical protein EVAR_48942_1 [Eumeta japonica]|uniref:Uncharacterized protein n=1 Tax=Eumeta variegata TaxID=151549 RepID=A0A4C1Y922_EUMVA|nr:hypothetical protein EVAR_48942_1 [Eumeta japonica]